MALGTENRRLLKEMAKAREQIREVDAARQVALARIQRLEKRIEEAGLPKKMVSGSSLDYWRKKASAAPELVVVKAGPPRRKQVCIIRLPCVRTHAHFSFSFRGLSR